jgi:hypothetical protein
VCCQDNLKLKRQMDYALEEHIPYMLIIGESEIRDGVVKVRPLHALSWDQALKTLCASTDAMRDVGLELDLTGSVMVCRCVGEGSAEALGGSRAGRGGGGVLEGTRNPPPWGGPGRCGR